MMRTSKSDNQQLVCDSSISGLLLCGFVNLRTKRTVLVDNNEIEIITYHVVDSTGRHYYVDDYSPSEYYDKGAYVRLPIYVKPYRKKTGDLSYSLNILKPYRSSAKGEEF